jgi:ATP synthase subunit 6
MDIYSPLEQFDIIFFCFGSIYITHIYIFFFIFFIFSFSNFFIVKLFNPSVIQYLFEIVYNFIREIIILQIGFSGLVYFPLVFSLFIFILLLNLIGMCPFGFTLTAQISLTFFFAFSINLGLIILGLYKHGIDFFNLFIAVGVSKFLMIFIFSIELMSYLIRTFSLSIRLFANMMAGHCLLYVFSLFVSYFFNVNFLFSSLIVVVIYIGLYILELCICFLQAYVFIVLICIYINDSLSVSH